MSELPHTPNIVWIAAAFAALVLPILAWAGIAWRKRRFTLKSLFILIAIEAVLFAALVAARGGTHG